MQAGRLRDRVLIQHKLELGRDSLGYVKYEWSEFKTLWANVVFNSGKESIKSDVLVSSTRVSIRVRYFLGINSNMRVIFDGQVYQILSVLGLKRLGYMDLVCEAFNEIKP